MKKSKLVKALLILSGITGMGIGGALLFAPVDFEASAGIQLGQDINLLSELRAPGGTLLVAGILIILGAFNSGMTFISILLSTLFYLSYGISRIFSMLIDGVPNESLVMAAILEMVIGSLSLFVFVNFKNKPNIKV